MIQNLSTIGVGALIAAAILPRRSMGTASDTREQFLNDHPLYFEVAAVLGAIVVGLLIMRLLKGGARPAATHDSETPAGESSHEPPMDIG